MLQRTHNRAHLCLALALLMMTMTLAVPLFVWVQILVVSAVGIQVALFVHLQKYTPSLRTVNLLAILSVITLIYIGWREGLLIVMLNLLVMGSALKLMTLTHNRDFFRLNGALVFLIGSSFIFEQTMFFSAIAATAMFLLLVSLAYHISPLLHWQLQLKRALLQCILALPIVILLFLIIPKLQPIWPLPESKHAKTGLSEKMTPGEIARLTQSSELAFRATFNGEFPTMTQRYWRALVLEDFDGESWQISPQRHLLKQQQLQRKESLSLNYTGNFYTYEMLVEPTQQPWLYSLDVAKPRTRDLWLSDDYQLQHHRPVRTPFHYLVNSYYNLPLREGGSDIIKQLNLQLPATGNAKARQWVAEMQKKHPTPTAFIAAVKQYFRQGGFRYTLRPAPMPVDSIDQLLFQYRAGFCAHYASAAAFMMREAGIPARVVTGYLGGEEHQAGYLSVYQYDAHAWIEIWQDNTGWQRLDVTALVAPDRARYGLAQAVAYENSFLADRFFALAKLKDMPLVNLLRITLADADYLWSRWLLGFDQRNQLNFFESMVGNLSPLRVAGLTLSFMMGVGLLLFIFQFRIWFPKIDDPLLHAYGKTLAQLHKKGVVKPVGVAPFTFALQVQQQTPTECGEHFMQLTQEFVRLRYQVVRVTPQQLVTFNQNVRLFIQQLKRI